MGSWPVATFNITLPVKKQKRKKSSLLASHTPQRSDLEGWKRQGALFCRDIQDLAPSQNHWTTGNSAKAHVKSSE